MEGAWVAELRRARLEACPTVLESMRECAVDRREGTIAGEHFSTLHELFILILPRNEVLEVL